MLRLALMRHGEAAFSNGDDHDRPLTDRGIAQANSAALLLSQCGFAPTSILSSDAKRTRQTTQCIVDNLNVSAPIVYNPMLYDSYTTQEFIDCIASSAVGQNLLVVAHNPDITYKASNLSAQPLPAAFPTAGILILDFNVVSWSDISARTGFISFSNFL